MTLTFLFRYQLHEHITLCLVHQNSVKLKSEKESFKTNFSVFILIYISASKWIILLQSVFQKVYEYYNQPVCQDLSYRIFCN